jgi:hypothetical protein
MKSVLIFVLLFFMVACGNEESPVGTSQKKGKEVNSMNELKTTGKKMPDLIQKDQEWAEEDQPFWLSHYMDLDNFSFLTGDLRIDVLKNEFDQNPKTKNSYRRDEAGDCAYSIKSMYNNKNETLHYMKGDCGEYGFSNDQYYLQNDSLKLIREFFVGINTWPDEQKGSSWKVKEIVYIFSRNKTQIKERELITTSDQLKKIFLIRKKPFVEKTVSLESIYEEKKKEMVSNLEIETTE